MRKSGSDIRLPAGTPIRIRFELKDTDLFARQLVE
jgi:hypothetical protein